MLPHGRHARRRMLVRRRGDRDAAPDEPRRPATRRCGEPRTPAAARRPPRRSPRARPRRRNRHRACSRASGRRVDVRHVRCAGGGDALRRAQGFDHGRRHQPHCRRGGRWWLCRRSDSAHARGHDARFEGRWRARESRSRHGREVRGATATGRECDMTFDSVEQAIDAVRRGEFVVVVDDEDRENEGDLIIAAEKMTPDKMAFMIRYTSGVICLPMEGDRLDELQLPLMVSGNENTEGQRTAFTVSVDAQHGTTTGISAADRAATVKAMIDPATKAADLARPGHIFPLRYREGGVLKRAGHTEAAVDLAGMAGCYRAGVLAEIVNDDGTMQRFPDLERFAAEHELQLVTIADLIRYRRHRDKLVRRVSEARIPTAYGDFTAHVFASILDSTEHVAFVRGEVSGKHNVLVRVHSECLTGDVFGSMRCDCGKQLDEALRRIADAGEGVVVYLRGHEGRGIGLGHKLRAYQLQEQGRDTVEANLELGFPVDSREYGIGAQILVDLGITTMRLMTNNPAKYGGIEGYGLEIVERVPVRTAPTHENIAYLRAKQEKLGHLLEIDDEGLGGS